MSKVAALQLLTLDDFKGWLESKESDSNAGQGGDGVSCPIATFLYEKGERNLTVDQAGLFQKGDSRNRSSKQLTRFQVR